MVNALKSLERRMATRNEAQVRRYFDSKYRHMIVKLLPGEHYVTGEPSEMIVTVLGSCVAACIRDPETGIGGMNHFMLPEGEPGDWKVSNAVMRYGNHAMEILINEILRLGCPRNRLEIKVFGGGNVIGNSADIGHRNADFVEEYLLNEGLLVTSKDLRGNSARRIHYCPATGKVDRLLMRRGADTQVFNKEKSYRKGLSKPKDGGDVELFE
ncbi:MAG: chemoreceptor glutamine deamidase CheD [Kordiimonadaceae bacterium]|nr:chemoreceptor glutamine deamidase CheD [Kordiimonadaceae bacterium]